MSQKRITLLLEERQQKMLDEIGEYIGIERYQAIIRQAVFEYHRTLFPAYLSPKKKTSAGERAEHDLERAEAMRQKKSERVFEEKKEISDKLEGQIFEEGGVMYSKFTIYEYMNPSYIHEGSMTLPLDELSEELLEIKWKGGKDKILEVLKKQKND